MKNMEKKKTKMATLLKTENRNIILYCVALIMFIKPHYAADLNACMVIAIYTIMIL